MSDRFHYRRGRLPHVVSRVECAPRFSVQTRGISAPARLIREHIPYQPGLFDNDRYPNCTTVALANVALGLGALNRGGYIIDPEAPNRWYADTLGIDVATIENTNGAYLLDVMDRQAVVGMTNRQDTLCGPFATIDPGDLGTMRTAMTFGGLPVLGVRLSLSDENMKVWDTEAPASAGDPEPGSGGLHALVAWDYTGLDDTDLVRLGTWGMLQPATWRWVRQRVDEMYAAAWRALMPASRMNWAKLDYEQMVDNVRMWSR